MSWIQPGVRFGSFQLELRGAKRADRLHLGRNYAALRDLKRGPVSWTLRSRRRLLHPRARRIRILQSHHPLGDLQRRRDQRPHAPRRAPRRRRPRHRLAQHLRHRSRHARADARHGPRVRTRSTDRLEVLGRVSPHPDVQPARVQASTSRTASRRAEASASRWCRRAADRRRILRLYRRLDSNTQVRDGSYLTGASFLLPHGWVQVNVSRFSPGEFPGDERLRCTTVSRRSRPASTTSGRARRSSAAGKTSPPTSIRTRRCPRPRNLPRTDRDARGFGGCAAAGHAVERHGRGSRKAAGSPAGAGRSRLRE